MGSRKRFNRLAICLLVLVCCGSGFVDGQVFDEQFEQWPVDLKINGTVIACGGTDIPQQASELFLRAAKKEDANPVTIRLNFDAGNDLKVTDEETISDVESHRRFEISRNENALTDEAKKAIQESKAVLVLAQQTISSEQVAALEQILAATTGVINRGGTVCFNGPLVELLGRFKFDSVDNQTTIRAVANLIPDAVIKTNYVDEAQRGDLLAVLAANPRCVGIGIQKDAAIVLRQRKIRVLGEGRATFCLMANEQLPIRIQHVGQAPSRRANPYETIVDLTAWRRDAIERMGVPFPAAVPEQPFVEKGTLLIVGGGGMPKGLMDQMVELAGGEDARLVYVPCSENDEVNGSQGMVASWKKMGVKSAAFIHTKDRNRANTDEAFLAPLKDATGIWFGGGRQWNFSDSYYGTRAHQLMKDVLARGGVIGGSSAGASIQARYMCRANPVANFDIMAPGYERGLGFISGIAIDQHFSQRGRQKDMTQLVNRYPQLLGIGIDEGTAIVVQKSQAEVVGRGKVHFYDRNRPVVPDQNDFIALESGGVFDLVQREVIQVDADAESEK